MSCNLRHQDIQRYWLSVGHGLLSLQQVRVEGECFYFFCFFTLIHFPLSPLSLSFISSTISSISGLSVWEMSQNDPHGLMCRKTSTQSIKILGHLLYIQKPFQSSVSKIDYSELEEVGCFRRTCHDKKTTNTHQREKCFSLKPFVVTT